MTDAEVIAQLNRVAAARESIRVAREQTAAALAKLDRLLAEPLHPCEVVTLTGADQDGHQGEI